MNEQELIEFLKKNLRVEVETGLYDITVSLYLGETLISKSEDELDFIRR